MEYNNYQFVYEAKPLQDFAHRDDESKIIVLLYTSKWCNSML